MPSLPAATVAAGSGFGTAFFGAFRMLAHTAAHEKRAQLFSAVYVVCYLANSVPAIVAGLVIPWAGLRDTASGYFGAVTGLALLSIPLGVLALRRTKAVAASMPSPAPLAETADTRL
jgi:Na+/melibiose symporter-like transporter